MKFIAIALLLWQVSSADVATPVAEQQFLRYQRTITIPEGAGQTCVLIDSEIFPRAAPSLKDLRLYQDGTGRGAREVPYAITLSEPLQPEGEAARVLNLGRRGNAVVFDLQMPARPYTEVELEIAGRDYLATAIVSGTSRVDPRISDSTHLGEFTLFDLTGQHLSRNTVIHLQESSFPYLHIELTASSAPGNHTFSATPQMVLGATIPPSREAQTLYTTVAETRTIAQRGRQSIASFKLQERVPVERISVSLSPDFKANFSRDVHISDRPQGTPPLAAETIAGTILRVRLTAGGHEIRQQQLSMRATLGANLQSPAVAEIAIENGDDPPLPLTMVRLEMRRRQLCFDAPTAEPLTLFYGDPALTAPQYDYARIFSAAGPVHTGSMGPQQKNPNYRSRPDSRPLTERYPNLLWIALLAVICMLAIVAIRSSRRLPR